VNTVAKQWGDSDAILEEFMNEDYQECEYGTTDIDPRKIIALSRPYEEIIHDKKIESLRKKVQIHGWDDPCPQTLHVYRLPTDDYVVGSGGNHRTVLSNELGLTSIQAEVTVFLPRSEIPQHIIDRLTDLDRISRELWKELRNMPEEDFQEHQSVYDQLSACDEEKDSTLKSVVDRLDWSPR
jgi:hypothetical protein